MNAVAAANRWRKLVLFCPLLKRCQQSVQIFEQQIACLRHLHSQRGVEHVRACHALVHKARFLADIVRNPCKEGDNIVLGHRFNSVDGSYVDSRLSRPPIPQGLCSSLRNHTQISQLLRGMGLYLEPDAIFRFRLPNGGHGWAGITRNHRKLQRRENCDLTCRVNWLSPRG